MLTLAADFLRPGPRLPRLRPILAALMGIAIKGGKILFAAGGGKLCTTCCSAATCPGDCVTCGDQSQGGKITITIVGGSKAGVYTFSCSGGTYSNSTLPFKAASLACSVTAGVVKWHFIGGASNFATADWFAVCPLGASGNPGGTGTGVCTSAVAS